VGFLSKLSKKVVALDTAPLIYFIERHPVYYPLVKPFFEALAQGKVTAITSTVTLVETMTHPLRNHQPELAHTYQQILLNADNLQVVALSPAIAIRAAQLRAEQNWRTPDAIQLATALEGHASFFLTNDHNLQKFTGLQVILPTEL
jgi:predicted nucleic acid-binding protein